MMLVDLFGGQLPEPMRVETRFRPSNPETSAAAARLMSGKISVRHKIVLGHFQSSLGMTDLDLQDAVGNHGSTYRTRRQELTAAGLLEDSGRRKVQHGTERVVWQVTMAGMGVNTEHAA